MRSKGSLFSFKKVLVLTLSFSMAISVFSYAVKAEENERPGVNLKSLINRATNTVYLESGIYYVDENLTIEANETAGIVGIDYSLKVAENSDVTIIVDKGVTLKAIGAKAGDIEYGMRNWDGTWPFHRASSPGIELPSGSTLTFRGEGTVVAKGGDGLEAENGFDGNPATAININAIVFTYVLCSRSYSGKGGRGAYASSPGIGGTTVAPGYGGSAIGGEEMDFTEDTKEYLDLDSEAGQNGSNGKDGNSMGTLRVLDSITLVSEAGENKTALKNGGSGSDIKDGYTWTLFGTITVSFAGHGGGGAGGIAGYSADIGGAGGSGGSGGSGAAGGGYARSKSFTYEVTAGTDGTPASGKNAGNGGSSGTMSNSYSSYDSKTGGIGGKQGKGGLGGKLYLAGSASVNGVKTNSLGSFASKVAGGNSIDGDGERPKAIEAVPIDVTVRHDDEIIQASKECEVTLYKDGVLFSTLSNLNLTTGEIMDSYKEFIAPEDVCDVCVNGQKTGLTISKDNPSVEVDFYTVTANVTKDNEPLSECKIELIQDGTIVYTLKETEVGKYTLPILKTHFGDDSNTYGILLDQKDTYDLVTNTYKGEATIDFKYVTAKVTVTNDGNDLSNQSAVLKQDDKDIYYLNDNGNGYCENAVFLYNDTASSGSNEYTLSVNGEEVTGLVMNLKTNPTYTAEYYTAYVNLQKDNENWTTASVVLEQDGVVKSRLRYENGKYITSLPSWSGEYDVVVYGVDGTDTGEKISKESKEATVYYYTVEFEKDSGIPYVKSIVQKGGNIKPPKTPSKNDATFDYWKAKGGLDVPFDFSTTVTSKISVVASWQLPKITIGTVVYCDQDNNINGEGKYYHMTNASLTGLPSSGGCVSAIMFDYTNAKVEDLISEQNLNFDKFDGVGTNTDVSGSNQSTKKLSYVFKDNLTLSQAQKFIRNVRVEPEIGKEHTMRITVYCNTNTED